MSSIWLDKKDLLEYNATYRVLICRECQYAIQKSAVSSHLLRHKIYREDRQRLLLYAATLDLAEPEDVLLPAQGFQAVGDLPIIPGYRCILKNCENLCASLKRMKRHRSEVHGTSDSSHVESFARPAMLQTFFRGTKLKYFEVADVSADGSTASAYSQSRDHEGDHATRGGGAYEREQEQLVGINLDDSILSEQALIPSLHAVESSSPSKMDLEMLTYFHHYNTVTSLTLPTPHNQPGFWHEVNEIALHREWLMCGLLAISAYHLAISSNDFVAQQGHREQATRFGSSFDLGFSLAVSSNVAEADESVAKRAGEWVHCLLRLARWASTRGGRTDFDLHSFITAVRTLSSTESMTAFGVEGRSQEAMFAEAKRILDIDIAVSTDGCGTRTRLLNHLRILPSRLSDIFGRPDNVQDVLATLSAIAALVVCCSSSFESDDTAEVWQRPVAWLNMCTEYFHSMIKNENSAALVLVSYWVVFVQRPERCGMWFLNGLIERMSEEIGEKLRAHDRPGNSLIEEYISKDEHVKEVFELQPPSYISVYFFHIPKTMRVNLVALVMVAGVWAVTQKTALTKCVINLPRTPFDYYMYDLEEGLCNIVRKTTVKDLSMHKKQWIWFKAYATWCKFFFDKDWESAKIDEPLGHADCPGLKNIKEYKASGGVHDSGNGMDVRCAKCTQFLGFKRQNFDVACYALFKLPWDGCLSCGPKIP
ncbi:hypothetical protein CC86DRAFT_467427 [Ophiobolus disseminans]|uniref:C2H2-type domain-containing protein n=1 Tax=Ophiobolus disseminans TaxID=1469910 RepID=A0A6A6ZZP9_9PLEO|nr:hypothetical protein CC86DRAFT_467427 [Ophiobolus disseminans]